MAKKYLFASYARSDFDRVAPLLDLVREKLRARSCEVEIWMDRDNLTPGASWEQEIRKALRASIGLLVFVSGRSMKSAWVSDEMSALTAHDDRLIIPVILEHVPELPAPLARWQWLDLSRDSSWSALDNAAQQIVDATEAFLHKANRSPPVSPAKAPELASKIAKDVRAPVQAPSPSDGPPDSIFLVHGHDTVALTELKAFLIGLGIKPVVLSGLGGASQSLLQKFFTSATEVRFAVVILSADDLGASRIQYDEPEVKDRALQFRARQNVILEMGFFYGHLGWEHVFVLLRKPNKVYPNFERPSDLDGAVFDTMDETGRWREALAARLAEAGFQIARQTDAA